MIVIAIIGILLTLALPAYAKYMARARFTEVIQAVNGVKKQVELCIFDVAPAFNASKFVNALECANSKNGNGWRIGKKSDFKTKYVANIVVSKGKITATAVSTNGLNSGTFVLVPKFGSVNNGVIDWERDDSSSCIENDLC